MAQLRAGPCGGLANRRPVDMICKSRLASFIFCFIAALLFAPSALIAREISVSTKPILHFLPSKPDQKIFGKLEFLGGLVLQSKDKHFGGISGARFSPKDGKLLAVTDKGRFLTFNLDRNENMPHNVSDVTITRLRGQSGKKLTGKYDKDAESLEIAGNKILVGFERNDRIEFYRRKDNKLKPSKTKKVIDLNPLGFTLNKGPEAIAHAPKASPIAGKILAFAEFLPNHNNNHSGYILDGKTIERLSMTESGAYSLTDAAFLANGDLLMLERRFSIFSGISMRIRRFGAQSINTGAVIDGEVLIEVYGKHEIDNMEAMALSLMTDGSTRVTLLSDDNFSSDQRTILLEFRLLD